MNLPIDDRDCLILTPSLWDMAGVDGLAVAQTVFGKAVGQLAPFQSVETMLEGEACSVLRLGDRNFRIVYTGSLDVLITPLGGQVWVQQLPWLGAIALSNQHLAALLNQAAVRPPHRLANLPIHQAVPAQITGIPVLIWRHFHNNQPIIELHMARTTIETLVAQIRATPDESSHLTPRFGIP